MLCLIVSLPIHGGTQVQVMYWVLEIHFNVHSKIFGMTGNTTTTTLLGFDTIFAAGY